MTIDDIRPYVRYLIGDNPESGSDIFTYENSNIFTLSEHNVISVNNVAINDITSGISYFYSPTTNKVIVFSSLSNGDTVEIQYTYYPNYSDTEIDNYIRAALVHLSVNNYYTFVEDKVDKEIYPDPTTQERNLIAFVAAILINPPIDVYRLPDLSITYPRDIPIEEKIRKTIAICKRASHGIFFVADSNTT